MQALSNAIKSMVNLGRFTWQATDIIPADHVLDSLKSCERLGDVHILYASKAQVHPAINDIGASPVSLKLYVYAIKYNAISMCCYMAAMESLESAQVLLYYRLCTLTE